MSWQKYTSTCVNTNISFSPKAQHKMQSVIQNTCKTPVKNQYETFPLYYHGILGSIFMDIS